MSHAVFLCVNNYTMRKSTAPVNFEINVEKEISLKFVFEQKAYDYYDVLDMFIKNPIIVSTDY